MPAEDRRAAIAEVGEQLAAKRAQAASLKVRNDAAMDAAVSEGTVGTEDFIGKFEAMTTEYDAVRDQAMALDGHHKRLMAQIAEDDGTAGQGPRDGFTNEHLRKQTDMGAMFMASDAWKHVERVGATHSDTIQLGATPAARLTDAAGAKDLITTGSFPLVPDRRTGILPLLLAPISLLDLVNVTFTDLETVEWVYEKTFTNTAAETAEGSTAPTGVIDFDVRQASVKEIPFSFKATRRILRDEARVQSWINTRMGYGVRARLQSQIIGGDGSGANLTGILHQSGILGVNRSASGNGNSSLSLPDIVHKAITAVRVASNGMLEPTVALMHPYDEERLVLTKATGTGNYLFAGPESPGAQRTVWGLTIVPHVGIPEGSPIVCDPFQAELALQNNGGVYLAMTDSNEDDFLTRKVAFLASIAGAFGLNYLQAFCAITNFNA